MARIEKTYDWINATADSNKSSATWTIIKIFTIIKDIWLPVFPRSVINRCPAIIFADKRIASVPGRITFLISSIYTIKGISG